MNIENYLKHREELMSDQQYDLTVHHRISPRLPNYNYSSQGAYFVTIRLQEKHPSLEDPQLRSILQETWESLPKRFPQITLDEFVIMADHIHFILWLEPQGKNRPSLIDIVRVSKSLTARAANSSLRSRGYLVGSQFWQRSFYDRIIRNEAELEQKRTYIRNNPLKDDLKHNRL
jgi:putative transposase